MFGCVAVYHPAPPACIVVFTITDSDLQSVIFMPHVLSAPFYFFYDSTLARTFSLYRGISTTVLLTT